jgi:hypothetical protein
MERAVARPLELKGLYDGRERGRRRGFGGGEGQDGEQQEG